MDDLLIAYCGVNCAACTDLKNGVCPGCKYTDFGDDPCMPAGCCNKKGIACCGECESFPCPDMAGFYQESESHAEVYRRMSALRGN